MYMILIAVSSFIAKFSNSHLSSEQSNETPLLKGAAKRFYCDLNARLFGWQANVLLLEQQVLLDVQYNAHKY